MLSQKTFRKFAEIRNRAKLLRNCFLVLERWSWFRCLFLTYYCHPYVAFPVLVQR